MTDPTKERLRVLGIGVATAVIAAALRAVIFPVVGTAIPFLTFFPAVIGASLWGGMLGGTTASLLSLFLAPVWMVVNQAPLTQTDWLSLGFFAAMCAAIIAGVQRGYGATQRSLKLGAKLEATEAHFFHMANTMPQLAWMARPDGHIFWYNQRWFEYTGTTPAEMEGWGWKSVHDPKALPKVMERWQKSIASGQPFDMTFPLKGADGTFHPFLTRVMPARDAAGVITEWFGTNTDVSEQRQMMEERQRLLESERAARAAAERANFLKDEFLATLSHELRTPLNAILGWTQHLRAGGDDNSVQEGLETIERNARAQTRIIEDLLEMSRIISGKTRLDVQPMDLRAVIAAAVETLAPAASAKNVRIVKVLDPIQTISGDPARIQQVLWNLLANAVKFTPKRRPRERGFASRDFARRDRRER